MSATGRLHTARGEVAAYHAGAAYYTQPLVAQAMVAWIGGVVGPGLRWLEPHVGGGAIARAVLASGLVKPWHLEVMDIDPRAEGMLMPGPILRTPARASRSTLRTGFLITVPQRRPDVVIGNPPFGVPLPARPCLKCAGEGCDRCKGLGLVTPKPAPVAIEHVKRAIEVSRRYVAFLCLGSLYAGSGRYPFWSSAPLRESRAIVPRPSFEADGGNDSAEYEVFFFDKLHRGPPTRGHLLWRDAA